jgi:predicted enzyme related to lactoylglutathione lyase
MGRISARLVGVELYFDDMDQAKTFYGETLGLEVSDEERGHYAKFDGGGSFVCLERKGSESYPSRDKAVLFFEVPDLTGAITTIGQHRFVRVESQWAVLHDPEGHNVLILQAGSSEPSPNLA